MAQATQMNFKSRLYLILAGIFIASLVSSNLIFQKFFTWTPFGLYTFEISVGILPYPITFLVTDLLSELYGKKKANQVVIAGLVASVFVMGVILLSDALPQTKWSPIDSETFNRVFGLVGPAVFASMVAYLTAQFIDIRMFHFWKRLTKGKHLWLRNNASTIISQLVDTASVLFLLCLVGVFAWHEFFPLFKMGFIFKVLVALFDTPVIYGVIHLLKGKVDIAPYQEG
ncbi:MAG TPA: VUT family protein [Candidatus Marinimicrobia bacterium]|nr:VUT family protein [Candidatus Neomarinimicrobiota bacterium]